MTNSFDYYGGGNFIPGKYLRDIARKLTKIDSLTVRDRDGMASCEEISKEIFEAFSSFKTLRKLDLGVRCGYNMPTVLEHIARNLTNLEELHILPLYLYCITNEDTHILAHLKNLKELWIKEIPDYCERSFIRDFQPIGGALKNLRMVCIGNACGSSYQGLRHLAASLLRGGVLRIGGSGLTNEEQDELKQSSPCTIEFSKELINGRGGVQRRGCGKDW